MHLDMPTTEHTQKQCNTEYQAKIKHNLSHWHPEADND